MIELTKIEHLQHVKDPVGLIQSLWDPQKEIDHWRQEARLQGIEWETRHVWNRHRRQERFHPSSLERKCDNYLYLELLGGRRVPKALGKKTGGIFDIGTACHLMFDYWMESRAHKHGYVHESEFKIENLDPALKLRMCGSADGYSERRFGNIIVRIIWELKTASGESFSRLGAHPKKSNLVQSHAYAHAADVPIIIVVYMNKENGMINCFIEPFDRGLWLPQQRRMEDLAKLANDERLITHAHRHITKSCRYCDFLEECRPEGIEIKTKENTEVRWHKTKRARRQSI